MKKFLLLFCFLLKLNSYSQEVGLIANFPFNSSVTSTVNSESFIGAVSYTTDRNGVVNNALSRTGGLISTNIAAIPRGSAARTISVWFKLPANSGERVFLEYGSGTSNSRFYLSGNSFFIPGQQGLSFGAPPFFQTTSFVINADVWYHYVVTTNASGVVRQYINGALLATYTGIINTSSDTTCFIDGGYNGAIDDLKIYNFELNASQVTLLNTNNTITSPLAPVISAISSTGITTSGATINYSLNANNLATTSVVKYGTVSGALTSTLTGFPASGTTTSAGSIPISGLASNTQYFYRIEATNSAGTTISPELSFTTLNSTPVLTFSNLTSSAITGTSATVSVTLSNVCAGAQYRLQYGTSPAFGAGTQDVLYSSGGTNGVKNHNLTGLAPNTLYYFRFYATVNLACNPTQIISATESFTTSNTQFTFSNLTSSLITPTTARVSVTLSNVCAGAQYRLQYATSPAFGAGTQDFLYSTGGTDGIKNHDLTGLTASTVYYYRFYAIANQACNATQIVSTTESFTTSVAFSAAPTISAISISSITTTSAVINYTLNANNAVTGSTVRYGLAAGALLSSFTSFGATGNVNISDSRTITSLSPNTQYFYRIDATNSVNTTQSAVGSFTTAALVTPTFTQVSPICSGATLSALPTTSNNGITGTWSPALNNTATTTYTFTPTAGQPATTATMTITVNSNVTPTFAAIAPICSGATLAALPTTSQNGITGTWSPALNNTATTTYTFTPTAGQCATTATLTITVNSNVTPTFAAIAPICSGATLSALPTTSTNGITGTWSPALNNTATTTYTFTPMAGQCATTQTLTITVNTTASPTGNSSQTFVAGQTIANIVVSPTNVFWYSSISDANSNANQLASSTLLVNNTTYYAVNVVGSCRSTPFAVSVTVTLSATDFNSLHFVMYPNPAKEILNIETNFELQSVEIYNIQGRKVLTSYLNQVVVSSLAEGFYTIRVQSVDGKIASKKLIIK